DELEVEELDAESRAREAEAQVERLNQRVKMLEGALAASRGKAPEPVAEANPELEARVAELEAELADERARRAELEDAAPVAEGGASAELVAERDQLKEDVAAMKRKLMAAETALETAASYKMKVTRLEAQLAPLKKGK
ncbi:MAG TPA: plectin 1 isoform 8, partial [Myxococcus sp.]|nr:plectin 1 isoform 8 [Myxococcus sp.]